MKPIDPFFVVMMALQAEEAHLLVLLEDYDLVLPRYQAHLAKYQARLALVRSVMDQITQYVEAQ